MTESVIHHPQNPVAAPPADIARQRICNLAWKIAVATFILMAIGSATRVMNAGLACPDWPLCYGQLVPAQQMNLQVFLEWFHRLDAMLIGFGTLALTGLSWWQRRQLPGWVPPVATLALGLVLFQGALGGLTVTELLRFDIVTAHLGTALLFFLTVLVMYLFLVPFQSTGTAGKLPWVGALAALLVYVQSLLGALVGSQWALHQCLSTSTLCALMHSHLWGVLPPSLTVLVLAVLTWRSPALHPTLKRLSYGAFLLLLLQIGLGFATFHLRLQVEPLTISHQAVGAALFGTLAAFAVLGWRDTVKVKSSAEVFEGAIAR